MGFELLYTLGALLLLGAQIWVPSTRQTGRRPENLGIFIRKKISFLRVVSGSSHSYSGSLPGAG